MADIVGEANVTPNLSLRLSGDYYGTGFGLDDAEQRRVYLRVCVSIREAITVPIHRILAVKKGECSMWNIPP